MVAGEAGLSLMVQYQPVHGRQHHVALLRLLFVLVAPLALADASPLVLICWG